MGELLHRHRERDDLSAPPTVSDAGPRRRGDVARGDRRHCRSGQQHPQSDLRPPGRSVGRAQAAGARRLRAVVAGAAVHRDGHHLGARAVAALRRSSRQRHSQLAPGCDARDVRRRVQSRQGLRLSPRDGPCRGGARPASRVGLSLFPAGRLPHAVRADHHPGDRRHPHPVAGAGVRHGPGPIYRSKAGVDAQRLTCGSQADG